MNLFEVFWGLLCGAIGMGWLPWTAAGATAGESPNFILTADCLTSAAVKSGALVQILNEWKSTGDGGVYIVMLPGRHVPHKTRLFVDAVTSSIQEQWVP
ncbi:MAG: hypothetical protein ABIP34_03465 [Rhodoferax sp.]|uniref:hypothetical protein n=1 Tax=Rhodoferax sp. TaxID=50421 RepID=UPI0032644692